MTGNLLTIAIRSPEVEMHWKPGIVAHSNMWEGREDHILFHSIYGSKSPKQD